MRLSSTLVLVAVSVVWAGIVACPIAPDFPVDSGVTDAGDAGGEEDAGSTGTIGATLTVSNASSTSLAWNGSEVAETSLDNSGQVTLRGIDNATLTSAGYLTIQITGLSADTTAGTLSAASYSTASGSDTWSCAELSTCVGTLTIVNFDGTNFSGTFTISFGADTAGNTAQLTNGSFSIVLP